MSTVPIRLVVSDIDGTLVTPDKTLTPAAIAAVADLGRAGIAFTVVSSRPPRGMAAVSATLGVKLPFAAFNGATLVDADGKLISARRLPANAAQRMLALLDARGIDAWVYADDTWRLKNLEGPRVPLERRTIGFDATLVAHFEDVMDRVDKIVGVSDDHALLSAVEAEGQALMGAAAVVQRSQPYYLDITAPGADKGVAVTALAKLADVPLNQTAVIGDMTNDVAMFRVAGLSIAMGNGPDAVKAEATHVTAANTEDGFAQAMRTFILRRS